MSRFEKRTVRARAPAGGGFEVPCLWVPRSGDKVIAVWRAGSVPAGSAILSAGKVYAILSSARVDDLTERAILAEISPPDRASGRRLRRSGSRER